MDKFLDKLRTKSHAYRIRLVFLISGAVTGIIAIVWLSLLGVSARDTFRVADEDLTPLSQLKANMADFVNGLRDLK